jgi:3-isopropylmalate/(R)-2-methylmalate dehydratase small subunit
LKKRLIRINQATNYLTIMASAPIEKILGRAVYVAGDDIDTDRIIPARFMKCITFDGLGDYLFYDVRKTEQGCDKPHNLNDPRYSGASILISGNNFGCGSSREHAPQAILRAGFRAVIAGSFAEIFFGNSTNLGVVCACASDESRKQLVAAIEADPKTEITIDVVKKQIHCGAIVIPFEIKSGARDSFLSGCYDPLDELLEGSAAVDAVVAQLPYMRGA